MDYTVHGNVLVLNKDVKKVDFNTFYNIQDSITQIILSEGLEEIEDYAFFDNINIEKIYLPDTLKEIGAQAFFALDNLKYLFIPKSVEKISKEAIVNCEKCTVLVERDSDCYGDKWYGNIKDIKFNVPRENLKEEVIKILYQFEDHFSSEDRNAFCDFTIDIIGKFPNFVIEDEDNLELAYVVSGEFVRYMQTLIGNDEKELTRCLEFIEDLHFNKHHCIQELATIGFVESIQNSWSQENKDYILKKLLPKTKKSWFDLNRSWGSK